MADLATAYLGFDMPSPLIASAGPLTGDPDNYALLAEAGAGAIVLPSLFEEEIELEPRTIDRHIALLDAAVRAVDIPVIASLNGSRIGGWIRSAQLLRDAGAHALELNLYNVAADPTLPGTMVEGEQLAIVELIADEIDIPVAVKISPYYSSVAAFAVALRDAGAAGVVLFNRFYQPDLDLETMDLMMRLSLSTPEELRLPLRWIGILSGHLGISLAASTGVHSGLDIAKVILAGGDCAMSTSALIRNGPEHIATQLAELRDWLDEHDHSDLAAIRGRASLRQIDDPEAFERANYLANLGQYTASFRGGGRRASR